MEIQLSSGVLVPRPQGGAGGGEACSQVCLAGSLQLSEVWCIYLQPSSRRQRPESQETKASLLSRAGLHEPPSQKESQQRQKYSPIPCSRFAAALPFIMSS